MSDLFNDLGAFVKDVEDYKEALGQLSSLGTTLAARREHLIEAGHKLHGLKKPSLRKSIPAPRFPIKEAENEPSGAGNGADI